MSAIPTLETARLRMRAHRAGDFEDFAAMWSDAAVVRYISGRPFSREESWSRLLRHGGHWAMLGFGFWAVEETATGAFVGEVGFLDLHRDISPPITVPEVGWVLAPRAHGKGYATEAVRAALDWKPGTDLVCLIHPENRASIRVAEKCGFRERERTSYHGQPTIVFGRSNSHR
jgi:RimJ/RimL family protein N-acetyltransferase